MTAAADHQDDLAIIPGRITDLTKPRLQTLAREMIHGPILAGPLPSWPTGYPMAEGNRGLAAAPRRRSLQRWPEHRTTGTASATRYCSNFI
jgi:hypothetical protein